MVAKRNEATCACLLFFGLNSLIPQLLRLPSCCCYLENVARLRLSLFPLSRQPQLSTSDKFVVRPALLQYFHPLA